MSKEYRPYFYELALLDVTPYPINVIAPGCSVTDNGSGVSLTGELTDELLRETLFNEQNGYMSHPGIVSGPYTLISYDAEVGTASFAANPYYKGNSEGEKPRISQVDVMTVTQESCVSLLADGTLTLIHKAVDADVITEGIALAGQPEYSVTNYTRSGLSMVSFCTEQPAVSDTTVRQAIAMCFDRNSFLTTYTGTYGLAVDGYYGIGQWLYQLVSGILTPTDSEGNPLDEATQEQWAQVNLNGLSVYSFNPSDAAALLERNGWQLNDEGVREKDGVALNLTLVCNSQEKLTEAFSLYLQQPLAEAGIRLTITPVAADELLALYYRNTDRSCDMIFVGTNFAEVFDPSLTYSTDVMLQGSANTTGLKDEKLYNLAQSMRSTEPGDLLTYTQRWVAFQEYWTQVLPAIPVYSNVYFDIYSSTLHGYSISQNTTWSRAILGAWLSDYTDAEAAAE